MATDALGAGATGAKGKFIALLDFSEGSDMIIGKPGVESIKDLKGQKIGVEIGLVEHLLLLQALKANGLTQADVTLVPTPTNNTPQTLASGQVAAVGAWYPVSGQALKQVVGSKKLFTSAQAKGLIYDVLEVTPSSLVATQGRVGQGREGLLSLRRLSQGPQDARRRRQDHGREGRRGPGRVRQEHPRHALPDGPEAKAAFKKGSGLDSIYGSLEIGNKFNLDNKVYTDSQKAEDYVAPSIVKGM